MLPSHRGDFKLTSIEWIDDDHANITASGSFCKVSGKAYTLTAGIKAKLVESLAKMITHPGKEQYGVFLMRGFTDPVWYSWIDKETNGIIDPTPYLDAINASFEERAKALFASLASLAQKDDFVFLATLRLDWKHGCAICLTDDIKGTTCGCGHTETVIFRPCGHSVCGRPCFLQLSQDGAPPCKTTTTDQGETFLMPGVPDYKRVKLSPHFVCPLCRSHVESVFEAETVNRNHFATTFDNELTRWAKDIIKIVVRE